MRTGGTSLALFLACGWRTRFAFVPHRKARCLILGTLVASEKIIGGSRNYCLRPALPALTYSVRGCVMEPRFIQLRAHQKNIDRYKLKTRLSETLLLVLFAIFNFVLFISTLISPPRRQNACRVNREESRENLSIQRSANAPPSL